MSTFESLRDQYFRGQGAPVEQRRMAVLFAHLGEGCRWIAVDRPGHGLSTPVDYQGSDYRAEAAAWLVEVLDGLGVEKISLVANSMGGYFALAFCLAPLRPAWTAGSPIRFACSALPGCIGC